MKSVKRTLVQQGNTTLMVSLPSEWIKAHNLVKGSEVNIDPLDNDIRISAKRKDVKTETTITIASVTESSIRTLITTTYRRGFDRIHVKYNDPKQLKILEDVVKSRLIGFEVVKILGNTAIIENITEPSEEQFDTILHKILYSIDEIFEITKNRLEMKDTADNYESVEERIQKYDNFCRRIISKQKFLNQKSELLWAFLAILIHAQRELYHLNRYVPKNYKVTPQVTKMLADASALYSMIKKAYFEKNIHYLSEVHEMEKKLIYLDGYKLLQESKGAESIILYHLMFCIREFYQTNSPLSGIIL